MKIATANQNGQIVIPANIRKKLKIKKDTLLKIYLEDNKICVENLDFNKNDQEDTDLNFKKRKNLKDFFIESEGSYAEDIDKIIYK